MDGYSPMGSKLNSWNFITVGSQRDAKSVEEVMIVLIRAGFDGTISIELEDNDAEKRADDSVALANFHREDLRRVAEGMIRR